MRSEVATQGEVLTPRLVGTCSIYFFLAVFVCCGFWVGCKFQNPRGGDHPDGIARDKLSSALTDLTFLPQAPERSRLAYIRFGRFFGSKLEPVAIFQSDPSDTTLARDSSLRFELISYRWDGNLRKFFAADRIKLRDVLSVEVLDVSRDGLADLLVYSGKTEATGLTILGVDSLGKRLITRYQSEGSCAVVMPMKDSTFALIERSRFFSDSQTSGVLLPLLPRRFLKIGSGTYHETPSDPAWRAIIAKTRDSVQQTYLSERSSNADAKVRIHSNHAAFARALIAETLLDPDLFRAEDRLRLDLADRSLTLATQERLLLDRLAATRLPIPFCEVALDSASAAEILETTALSDALLRDDTLGVVAQLKTLAAKRLSVIRSFGIARSVERYLPDRQVASWLYRLIYPSVFAVNGTSGVSKLASSDEASEFAKIGAESAKVLGRQAEAEGLFERAHLFDSLGEAQQARQSNLREPR